MSNSLFYDLSDPLLSDVLENGTIIKICPRGNSMEPFLRSEKDVVFLQKVSFPLKKNDIYLYRRSNGRLVIHRCKKKCGRNYVFRGDNQIRSERDVTPQQVMARVIEVERSGKILSVDSQRFRLFALIAYPYCLFRRIPHECIKIAKKRL